MSQVSTNIARRHETKIPLPGDLRDLHDVIRVATSAYEDAYGVAPPFDDSIEVRYNDDTSELVLFFNLPKARPDA